MSATTYPVSPSHSMRLKSGELTIAVADYAGVFDLRTSHAAPSSSVSASAPPAAENVSKALAAALEQQQLKHASAMATSRWIPPAAVFRKSMNIAAPPSSSPSSSKKSGGEQQKFHYSEMQVAISDLDASYDALPPLTPGKQNRVSRPIRIVAVSDTHLWQDYITLPKADILIHCGDMLSCDSLNTPERSAQHCAHVWHWFHEQQKHSGCVAKLFIFGNHDHGLEQLMHHNPAEFKRLTTSPAAADGRAPAVFLQGDQIVDVCGVRIRGSSYSYSTGSCNKSFQSEDLLKSLACPVNTVLRIGGDPQVPSAPGLDILATHCVLQKHRELMQHLNPAIALGGHYHAYHGVNLQPGAARKGVPQSQHETADSFFTERIVNMNVSILASSSDPPRLHAPMVFDVISHDAL